MSILLEAVVGQTGKKLKREAGRYLGGGDGFWTQLGKLFKKYRATAVVFAPGVASELFRLLKNYRLPITNAAIDEIGFKTKRYGTNRLLSILERARVLVPEIQFADIVLKHGTPSKKEAEEFKSKPKKRVMTYKLEPMFERRLVKVIGREMPGVKKPVKIADSQDVSGDVLS